MNKESEAKINGSLALTNSGADELRVTLEPWADNVVIGPGQTVHVSYSGPAGGRIEIDVGQGELVVYGWEGSTMSIDTGAHDTSHGSR